MGQIYGALVLFFVIFCVEARPPNSEDDSLCSQDHPLHPYLKLFDVIPEEWKKENDSPNKIPVCFTRIITTELDENGKELNKFSSYEITFGLPKKYEYISSSDLQSTEEEYNIYPLIEETSKLSDIETTKIISIKCSKHGRSKSNRKSKVTTTAPDTVVNHDLDFLNDMEEICEDQLNIDVLDSLPNEDATPEPDVGNTRKSGGNSIENIVGETTTVEPEINSRAFGANNEMQQDEPNFLSQLINKPSEGDVTTELIEVLTEILQEMSATESTIPNQRRDDFAFSLMPFDINGKILPESKLETATQIPVTTQAAITEEPAEKLIVVEAQRRDDVLEPFVIKLKNIGSPKAKPKCFRFDSHIKYGKCTQPLLPIRILTESYLPKRVVKKFVKNLEKQKDADDIIVSGKKNCYLLKNLTETVDCPSNPKEAATLLEIDNLPENKDDKEYFSISLNGKCKVVSKNVDVIECPIYGDTLPHLETDNLPDHVRFKHFPGKIDVHLDDIVLHSFSHCLLLKTMKDNECIKADIVLQEKEMPEEVKTTNPIPDEDESIPTFRLGDYSIEKLNMKDDYNNEHLTTPCEDDDDNTVSLRSNTDSISRTTRTLSTPVTEASVLKRKSKDGQINARRTLTPELLTTETPTTVTEPITTISEVKIPNSKKLSTLLETIIAESVTDPMPRSYNVFKPDFIVKIGCANDILAPTSCFYVSKYIMKPSFDVDHDFTAIMDKNLLPIDAKIVPAPNLNIFGDNETIYAQSESEKFVLIKKEKADCPENDKDTFLILSTKSCGSSRRTESLKTDSSIVKYSKGHRVYCFEFDENLKLGLIKCPEDLSRVAVLSRPEDLKTLCRSQLKNKNRHDQMTLLRRLNIVTDYD